MASHPRGNEIASLDGIRATSILLVIAAHMLPLGPKTLHLTETAGATGMSLFFILSGFLITSTLLRNPDVYEFIVRRLARIIPLAYLYTTVVFILFTFNPPAAFWTDTFLINYTGQLNPYNWHFWSLCIELQFYAAIALVVMAFGRRGIWLVWPACLAITLARVGSGAMVDIRTHLRVDDILAGACVATLYRPEWVALAGRRAAVASIMAIGVLVVASHPEAGWFQYLRPYAAALVLIVVLRQNATWLARLLGSAPARYVANISYALYVIHPISYVGWFNDGSLWERYLLKRPISFLLTFTAAHLSTRYWERPWRQMASRMVGRRRAMKRVDPAPAE